MVRKYDTEEEERGGSFTYWLAVILIIMVWVFAFKCYFSNYENVHPDLAWAAPGMNRQIEHAEGVYLWEETVLNAPLTGKVYYPQGTGPVRVSYGQVVTKVVSEAGTREIRAFQQGYFIAGTDGKEGNWRYSLIWPDLKDKLPEVNAVQMHAEGDLIEQGHAVGKLIPQPQNLRFIGLIDAKSPLKKQIKDKKLRLMMDDEDSAASSEVSISVEDNGKIKFLVTMPWFNTKEIANRKGTIVTETGRAEGAMIPSSAVVEKHGVTGVYLVRGTRVMFREIKGEAAGEDKYLVTEGITAGDAIVENAKDTKEGRIQIW